MVDQSTGPISQAEMIDLFGEAVPIEAAYLIWSTPGYMTVGELRTRLREIAGKKKEEEFDLEEIAHKLHDTVEKFRKYWVDGRKDNPENFPEKLSYEDWDEQFESYLRFVE